jgi:hypothetical protein
MFDSFSSWHIFLVSIALVQTRQEVTINIAFKVYKIGDARECYGMLGNDSA